VDMHVLISDFTGIDFSQIVLHCLNCVRPVDSF
jgi:hypothetical protein